MALRLDQVVLSGEIINTRHYSTHGWLEFRGRETPVRLELTGNCGAGLAGCHFQFKVRTELQDMLRGKNDRSPREAADIEWLADQQVGPTGDMFIRQVRWFDRPPDEAYLRCKLGEPPPETMKTSLYLEWYSQNGRVVLKLVDPEIEFVERTTLRPPAPGAHLIIDPPPGEFPTSELTAEAAQSDYGETLDEGEPDQSGLGVTIVGFDDDGNPTMDQRFFPAESDAEESEERSQLQRQLDAEAAQIDHTLKFDCDDEDKPQHIRELELMDNLIESGSGHPFSDLFEGPLQLPKPFDVSEQDAEGPLKAILVRLAMFGIAIHVCPRYTPKETYRWLQEDIFREELAHPELKHTQWVQGFSTGESSCPACEAELEREWAQRKQNASGRDPEDPPVEPK